MTPCARKTPAFETRRSPWALKTRTWLNARVDDARRLRSQEKAIAQLERSVHAYQDERDELEVAVKRLKQAVSESARISAADKHSKGGRSEAADINLY